MTAQPHWLGDGAVAPNGAIPGGRKNAYPTAAIKTGAVIQIDTPPSSTSPRVLNAKTAVVGKRNAFILGVALGAPATAAQIASNAYGDAATASSTSQPIVYQEEGFCEAQVESTVAANEELVVSHKTAGKLRTRPANVNADVSGTTADTDITVTGIRKEHAHDLQVLAYTVSTDADVTGNYLSAADDITSTVTITADDTIQSSEDTSGRKLIVRGVAAPAIAIALEAARASGGSSTAKVANVYLLGHRAG